MRVYRLWIQSVTQNTELVFSGIANSIRAAERGALAAAERAGLTDGFVDQLHDLGPLVFGACPLCNRQLMGAKGAE